MAESIISKNYKKAVNLIKQGEDRTLHYATNSQEKPKTIIKLAETVFGGPFNAVLAIEQAVKSRRLIELVTEIDSYIQSREKDSRRYKNRFSQSSFFNLIGYSRDSKLSAAKALKDYIEQPGDNKCLDKKHKGALTQGELGKIFKEVTQNSDKVNFGVSSLNQSKNF